MKYAFPAFALILGYVLGVLSPTGRTEQTQRQSFYKGYYGFCVAAPVPGAPQNFVYSPEQCQALTNKAVDLQWYELSLKNPPPGMPAIP